MKEDKTVTTYAPDSFDALQLRFMSLMSRFQVVSEVLNCEDLPNELAPAGYVLKETTKELEQLYDDFDLCRGIRKERQPCIHPSKRT